MSAICNPPQPGDESYESFVKVGKQAKSNCRDCTQLKRGAQGVMERNSFTSLNLPPIAPT